MKKKLCLILSCISCFYCFSQVQDTGLLAHSERWKVKLHRPMFGLGKPEFGPFTTIDVDKIDSPVLRKKSKEGSYTGVSYNMSEGWDWDFSKYQTVEKRKAYTMVVAGESDTAELLFSIYSVSKEKDLTFFGELMSKNDEGKNLTLGYKIVISGIGTTSGDSLPWRFLLEDSSGQTSRFTRGYIITEGDSLFTEPIITQPPPFYSKFLSESQTGVYVTSTKGTRIAAVKFGIPGDLSNAFYTWIRNDLASSERHAIASLFALLISAKTKQ